MNEELITLMKAAAVNIYVGCAPDMGEHDLDGAVDFVADCLYDKFGGGNDCRNCRSIAREALKPYFGD